MVKVFILTTFPACCAEEESDPDSRTVMLCLCSDHQQMITVHYTYIITYFIMLLFMSAYSYNHTEL